SHARFNGRKMLGRMTAARAKAKATPKAHHRGSDPAMSGQTPTSTNAPANRAPKLRSELSEMGAGGKFGSRTTAMPHLRCCVGIIACSQKKRGRNALRAGRSRSKMTAREPHTDSAPDLGRR